MVDSVVLDRLPKATSKKGRQLFREKKCTETKSWLRLCQTLPARNSKLNCVRCHQQCQFVPRVRRSPFGTHAFSVAGPTVCNPLPDHLRDVTVDSEKFRQLDGT